MSMTLNECVYIFHKSYLFCWLVVLVWLLGHSLTKNYEHENVRVCARRFEFGFAAFDVFVNFTQCK